MIADGTKHKAFILSRHKALGQYDFAFTNTHLQAPSTGVGRALLTALVLPEASTIKEEPEN